MKKQLLLILMALLPILAMADVIEKVEIDGLYYNLITKGNVAEVTSKPSMYTGDIVIPSSVTYSGASYSVTGIGNDAFSGCSGLTSVTIPNSVTSIGGGAFANCRGLKSITIPNSVTSIDSYAFYNCTGLTAVYITDLEAWCKIKFNSDFCNPLDNSHHLFLNGTEVTELVIPNTITKINDSAFSGASSIVSVSIPNSVISIGERAFWGCSGLTSATIGSSVTSIGGGAFAYCSGLTSVTIPNNVTSIGRGAFEGCTGLSSITIPNSVTSIGESVFYNCTSLLSITIPNSVTSIGENAFRICSGLTSVTIGSGVKSIGQYTFAYCKELTDVYCLAERVPNTNADAFKDSYVEYCTLHVPAVSLNNYKGRVPWSQFGKFMAIGDVTLEKCATPTISYGGKKLTFSCSTEGVEYVYEIKDSDIKKGYDSEIQLTATYEISVYATKAGYENSDVATATLVWGSASFTETTGTTSARPLTIDTPILIQSNGGVLTVQGVDDGTQVSVYGINGTEAGKAISRNGSATVNTNLQTGSVAIVKIGQKSVKVVVK